MRTRGLKFKVMGYAVVALALVGGVASASLHPRQVSHPVAAAAPSHHQATDSNSNDPWD